MSNGCATSVCQTLLVDLFLERSASITAASNLVRNAFRYNKKERVYMTIFMIIFNDIQFLSLVYNSSVATAVLQPIVDSVGIGWVYTIFGIILSSCTASVPLLLKYGENWRKVRAAQEERRREKKEENEKRKNRIT